MFFGTASGNSEMSLPQSDSRRRRTERTALSEPILIERFWKTRAGASVEIRLKSYEGRAFLDVREYQTSTDGKSVPTKKGVTVAIPRIPELAHAVSKAYEKAIDIGLLKAIKP